MNTTRTEWPVKVLSACRLLRGLFCLSDKTILDLAW